MNTFPAKLDTLAKMITVVVPAVLLIPFITIGQHFSANHEYKIIAAPVIVIMTMIFTVLFMPKSYLVNPSVLKIMQIGFSKTIPLENVESILPVTKSDLGFGIRAFGSGGFLGYLGKFWYSKTKFITFYVTNHSKMLLILLKNGKKIMISPDDQEGFLAAFNAAKHK